MNRSYFAFIFCALWCCCALGKTGSGKSVSTLIVCRTLLHDALELLFKQQHQVHIFAQKAAAVMPNIDANVDASNPTSYKLFIDTIGSHACDMGMSDSTMIELIKELYRLLPCDTLFEKNMRAKLALAAHIDPLTEPVYVSRLKCTPDRAPSCEKRLFFGVYQELIEAEVSVKTMDSSVAIDVLKAAVDRLEVALQNYQKCMHDAVTINRILSIIAHMRAKIALLNPIIT